MTQANISMVGFEESSSMYLLRLAYESLQVDNQAEACRFLKAIDSICETKPGFLELARQRPTEFVVEAAKQVDLEKNTQLQGAVQTLIKELSGQ